MGKSNYYGTEEYFTRADVEYEEGRVRKLSNFFEMLELERASGGKFRFFVDAGGRVTRLCIKCGSCAEFSSASTVDFAHECIPFDGELDANDAPDNVPGCYGLGGE